MSKTRRDLIEFGGMDTMGKLYISCYTSGILAPVGMGFVGVRLHRIGDSKECLLLYTRYHEYLITTTMITVVTITSESNIPPFSPFLRPKSPSRLQRNTTSRFNHHSFSFLGILDTICETF